MNFVLRMGLAAVLGTVLGVAAYWIVFAVGVTIGMETDFFPTLYGVFVSLGVTWEVLARTEKTDAR